MKSNFLATRLNLILVIILITSIGAALWQTQTGSAASVIEVNTSEDVSKNDGQCSLREAVTSANKDSKSGGKPGECSAGSGPDTILLPAGIYTLSKSDNGQEDSSSTGDLDIRGDLYIIGDGPDSTVINTIGDFTDRIFHVISGNVEISNLKITGGHVRDDGGSIYNLDTLSLTNVIIDNNTAGNVGGGIYNAGSLELLDSTLSNNSAANAGGGIYNTGNLLLTNATISNNFTTLEGNIEAGGGGFYNAGGSADFINVTVSENGSTAAGTPASNLNNAAGTVSLKNTILANPVAGENCAGTITSLGHNLSSDASCATNLDQTSDKNNVDARLGDLKDNGGQTPTHALLTGSPAIDAGDNASCPATDQRGTQRPLGGFCDMGSFETSGNDSWVTANPVNPDVTVTEYIDLTGQSRWYKFSVKPGQQIILTLKDLPANYDMTLYKDIAKAYKNLTSPEDLPRLDAEFAPDAFSPDAFSPDAFSPDAFSPDAFSPDAFSPDAFSPDAFSPDAFSPDAFSPDAFSPDAFSPDAFSPDAFSPDAFSPDAFSGAQTRSLIAVSAFEGTSGEGIIAYTWDNDGDYYVRVRGRNGVFYPSQPFTLDIIQLSGQCETVSDAGFSASSITPTAGNYETIILWDSSRLSGTSSEISSLQTQLGDFADLPSVNGVVVDVSTDIRVVEANTQADQNTSCPYAKNLVAEAVEDIIDGYWELNPLEYVVIAGNDDVIPFFREPDHAMLANEKNYVPPVKNSTHSQSSLKLGYFLSQDRYGSAIELSLKESVLPLPALAVGRLVETPGEISRMLDAYAVTNGGVVNTPTSTLVTGYDFLEDAALAIQSELEAGTGNTADTLITPRDVSPQDEASWNAQQLKDILLGQRHDLVFLAGHFSASSALAADYTSRLLTTDIQNSGVDMENSIIFSAGCHAGYNIVNEHDVPGVTREPDWAQVFASKGATLIAGTGYQYGDTDFIEYSERLYREFSQQLRVGTGPVPIGKALVAAKQVYLANTPQMRGIHEKALLEATLFGLPMLSVDMPNGRIISTADVSEITGTNSFTSDPGFTLGLQYADLNVTPSLTTNTVTLTKTVDILDPGESLTVEATYLSGTNGVIANPAEPVLPLESRNVSVPGYTARGVGFRSGTYVDLSDVIPLTGAATTEVRGVHTPFLSDVYFPIKLWGLNYFDTLVSQGAGETYLNAIPAQFLSGATDSTRGTLRKITDMDFRLYYSNEFDTYAGGSVPALAAAPSITSISSAINNGEVTFGINVLGNPSAGIQEVWITYTAESGHLYGSWQSLDLVQNTFDSTLWEGTLNLANTPPEDVRFMVQAVNGVGLVGMATNLGLAYIPGVDPAVREPTTLSLEAYEPTAPYGTRATFSAVLTTSNDGTPLVGERVLFRLGSQTRVGQTDGSGRATATIPLLGIPGEHILRTSFPGTAVYAPSEDTGPFTITRQYTAITLDPEPAMGRSSDDLLMTAYLKDATGRSLAEKTVFFVLNGTNGESFAVATITDYAGRAPIGSLPLTSGVYSVQVSFSGQIVLPDYTLTLFDDRYEPAAASGTLTLANPPAAENDVYSAVEDIPITIPAPGVLGNDTDPDGDTLSAQIVDSTSFGTLALNPDGSFSYTPDANYNGADTFTYAADDGFAVSNSATVTITLTAVNDVPLVVNDEYSVVEDQVLSVASPGVLGNDSDVEGDPLSVIPVSDPQNGALNLDPDGSFTYTPNENFSGSDSFTYLVSDGNSNSGEGVVTISVSAVNDTPVATADAYSILEDKILNVTPPGVLGNDFDVDGDALSALIVDNTSFGMLVLNPDGSFTYTPFANYFGPDAFTYYASDGLLQSSLTTVSISVTSANDLPVCDNAYSSTNNLWPPNGELYPVDVMGVTDPDGDAITITITSIYQDEPVGNVADGVNLGSTAEVRAERDGNGNGRVYEIGFLADDGRGGTCSGVVEVAVIPHDKSGSFDAINDGAIYDSTKPE